ncbi:MAG TPA: glycine oxidase ThiO [Methylomirabilota bacterium]|nr:glycine oxidase ThiO [Methylomirabilota bacterium]
MSLAVLIVGGGIIGCSIAYELAKAGARVTVLERTNPGAEASSAAAGLLAPLGESARPDPFHALAIESWRLYPRVVAELAEVTGIQLEYHTAGSLYPLFGRAQLEAARERMRWPAAAEFGIEVLEGLALRQCEPGLSPDVRAALFVRGDHWIHNEALVSAYAAAAAARGVTIKSGVEVSRIVVEGVRAVGVLAQGERVAADVVVLAAGAWSGGLAQGVGFALPVGPVRGQMLAVDHDPPLVSHAIHGEEVYMAPRRSGELFVGATVEHVGFERRVTPEALEQLIGAAVRLVPALDRRRILRSWCGFRPWASDSLPVLGPLPGIERLYVATGHFRNGILLAPITASLISRCILDGEVPALLEPFLPHRFSR